MLKEKQKPCFTDSPSCSRKVPSQIWEGRGNSTLSTLIMSLHFPRLITATLALSAIATAAQAQRLSGTQAIQYGDITIPAFQAQPPAGHNDIAFRPACRQINPIAQANGFTAYALYMPDGMTRVLYEVESETSIADALAMLGDYGICKSGSELDGVIDVPIIYTSQLPQSQLASPEAVPVDQGRDDDDDSILPTQVDGDAGGVMGLAWGGGAFALIFIGYRCFTGRKQNKNTPIDENQGTTEDTSTKSTSGINTSFRL